MKKSILFTLIAFCCLSNLHAQTFSNDVPFHTPFDSSYVVGQGMVDSLDISQHFQGYNTGQFVLCHNSVFTFKGNQSSSSPTFYLFPGATLILKDTYFYPTVYMSDMSVLDADSGNQNLICYRESSSILMDTSNVLWLKDSTLPGAMTFTFGNWPNASSPCTISPPQGVNDLSPLEAKIFMQGSILNYGLKEAGRAHLSLFDLYGKKLQAQSVKGYGRLDLSNLASGIYIVTIEQKGRVRNQKILLN